jgi:hypothetical protein
MESLGVGLTLRARLLRHTEDAGTAIKRLQDSEPNSDHALTAAKALVNQIAACIADVKGIVASRNGVFAFKVLNLPPWPKARITAWLQRQKINCLV